jgi:hypothetical protein
MSRLFKALAVIVLLIVVGCSDSTRENDDGIAEYESVNTYFTGKIQKLINDGDEAIVYAKLGGSEGEVIVNLTVNSDRTYQVGDKVKVGYDGTIMESTPAKINTLSVELVD